MLHSKMHIVLKVWDID